MAKFHKTLKYFGFNDSKKFFHEPTIKTLNFKKNIFNRTFLQFINEINMHGFFRRKKQTYFRFLNQKKKKIVVKPDKTTNGFYGIQPLFIKINYKKHWKHFSEFLI